MHSLFESRGWPVCRWILSLLVVLSPVMFFSCSSSGKSTKPAKALFDFSPSCDVLLEVTPIRVKEFEIGSIVDAIEGDPSKPHTVSAIVLFRIEKTLRGEFTVVRANAPSVFEQFSDNLKEHSASSIIKILTANFESPDDLIEKGWITVAVEDAGKTFGITSWDGPVEGRFRLCLKRMAGSPDSYILTDVKKA